jgi:hypothetical protein
MSNVHALLFEGFAKHKLVMRSSHRWDHSTPYPNAVPSSSWIRKDLRRLVQTTACISVATEWDYWYSRFVQIADFVPSRSLIKTPPLTFAFFSMNRACIISVAGTIIALIPKDCC